VSSDQKISNLNKNSPSQRFASFCVASQTTHKYEDTTKMMLYPNRISAKVMAGSLRSTSSKRTFSLVQVIRAPPMLIHHSNRHALPVSTLLRHKSSAAVSLSNDTDAFSQYSKGHAAAAAARTKVNGALTRDEPWMINLERGKDNPWLTGPRSEDWFTGLPPSQCPGKSRHKSCRSSCCFNL
jgi:hypothetical protein